MSNTPYEGETRVLDPNDVPVLDETVEVVDSSRQVTGDDIRRLTSRLGDSNSTSYDPGSSVSDVSSDVPQEGLRLSKQRRWYTDERGERVYTDDETGPRGERTFVDEDQSE